MNLDHDLRDARERLRKATAALAPRHKGGEIEEYEAAHDLVLSLERRVAGSTGEQYAETIGFPVRWDIGAPMPHVVANEQRVFLLFFLGSVDPNWDGTYVTTKELADPVAVVEFHHCASFRLGSPNDEVFSGHPLSGHGLEPYCAQIVRNSRWRAEVEGINRVHSRYDPDRWKTMNHYVLWFHDSTFECLAESYRVEVCGDALPTALLKAVSQVNERSGGA